MKFLGMGMKLIYFEGGVGQIRATLLKIDGLKNLGGGVEGLIFERMKVFKTLEF
jgi:hypothetical protein